MMNEKKLVFDGGPFQSYWWADEHEPYHLNVRVTIDEIVDGEALAKAWEKTKRVYPLVACVPDDEDEKIYFYAGEKPAPPVQSAKMIKPGSETVMREGFALSFCEDVVTLSAYHSLADEIGLLEILKTLICFYGSQRFDKSETVTSAMTKENRKPEEYFVQNTVLATKDYRPCKVVLYNNIKDIFFDETIKADEDGAVTVGAVDIPYGEIKESFSSGNISEDDFVAALMAKTIENIYPEDERSLAFGMLTDFREAFGIKDTIAPCSKRMPLVLNRAEVKAFGVDQLAGLIAGKRTPQKREDYIKTHVAMENTYGLLNLRNVCAAVNFTGNFDMGAYTSHIKNIMISDYSLCSLFAVKLGDKLKVCFQYGARTDEYMKESVRILSDMGVDARISMPAEKFFEKED